MDSLPALSPQDHLSWRKTNRIRLAASLRSSLRSRPEYFSSRSKKWHANLMLPADLYHSGTAIVVPLSAWRNARRICSSLRPFFGSPLPSSGCAPHSKLFSELIMPGILFAFSLKRLAASSQDAQCPQVLSIVTSHALF